MAATLLAIPDVAGPLSAEVKSDPRMIRLQKFFSDRNCPAKHLASDFIEAADRQGVDWRLLPSISYVESTGGKHARNNNIFGWQNGNRRFPTVRQGIHTVAHELARSPRYKDKTLDAKLWTYNPSQEYNRRVKQIMLEIGPSRIH
ncbi:MAG: hypothetical protein NTZ56_18445 [Acidobacteria bacterium]|nr:hypothetical protein [Acidobacteriota bacterium]